MAKQAIYLRLGLLAGLTLTLAGLVNAAETGPGNQPHGAYNHPQAQTPDSAAIGGGIGNQAGDQATVGGGSWQSLSSRTAKANVEPVDPQEILARLQTVPVTTWNYRAQEPSIWHIGPMAEDFRQAFGLGEDERYLNSIDTDGVSLAAIQGLYQLAQQQAAQIATLEQQLTALTRACEVNQTTGEGPAQNQNSLSGQ